MRRALLPLLAAAVLLTALTSALSVAGAAPRSPQSHTVYLPLVASPPVVDLRTGPSSDERGAIAQPTATLPAGAAELHIDVRIRGARGLTYHVEVAAPDGRTYELGSGAAYDHEQFVRGRVCFGTFGSCGSPLPSGSYVVRVLLDSREAAAVTVGVP
jgi:hypothetical protein